MSEDREELPYWHRHGIRYPNIGNGSPLARLYNVASAALNDSEVSEGNICIEYKRTDIELYFISEL